MITYANMLFELNGPNQKDYESITTFIDKSVLIALRLEQIIVFGFQEASCRTRAKVTLLNKIKFSINTHRMLSR